jgi:hypothetical protein
VGLDNFWMEVLEGVFERSVKLPAASTPIILLVSADPYVGTLTAPSILMFCLSQEVSAALVPPIGIRVCAEVDKVKIVNTRVKYVFILVVF